MKGNYFKFLDKKVEIHINFEDGTNVKATTFNLINF